MCYFFFDSTLSHVQWYHRSSLSSLRSVFTFSNAFHRFLSFLLYAADLFHIVSSLLILITSLYLLSFSIYLDSILCSMYYDLSISYYYSFHPFLFLYSSSNSTTHFHSFSCQHTLSSPFFHSIPVLFFNSMALESQRSPKRKVVTQFLDYLDK